MVDNKTSLYRSLKCAKFFLFELWRGGGELRSPHKMDGGARATFQGLQKAVLAPLRMFDEERSTTRAFAVP